MRTVQQVAGEKMEGPGMPLIHAKSIEQGLTPPEEKKIATKLTDASASIDTPKKCASVVSVSPRFTW